MLFSIGNRVRFKNTSDEGVVTQMIDGDMIMVLLDEDDVEIPAFIDDLERAEGNSHKPPVKAKIVRGKRAREITPPDREPAQQQYAIIKSKGLQLAFDPILKYDALAEKFKMYLINDTRHEALFTLTLKLSGRIVERYNGKINAMSVYEVGDLLFDQLNDSPLFEVECWRVTTAGTEGRLHKTLRIKPKQFFKKISTAPLLNKPVHLFKVFEQLTKEEAKKQEEDLASYTKRNARTTFHQEDLGDYYKVDILEIAEFKTEMDLHIERLVPHHQKLNTKEILSTQLFHFEQYLAKAIRLGIERVYIIHGVGKGTLKNEIANILKQNDQVVSFKNEYHPKYGYGATEVNL